MEETDSINVGDHCYFYGIYNALIKGEVLEKAISPASGRIKVCVSDFGTDPNRVYYRNWVFLPNVMWAGPAGTEPTTKISRPLLYHPEAGPDEQYVGNTNHIEIQNELMPLKTARLGNVAYTIDGKTISDMKPLIIGKSDLAGYDRIKMEQFNAIRRR